MEGRVVLHVVRIDQRDPLGLVMPALKNSIATFLFSATCAGVAVHPATGTAGAGGHTTGTVEAAAAGAGFGFGVAFGNAVSFAFGVQDVERVSRGRLRQREPLALARGPRPSLGSVWLCCW